MKQFARHGWKKEKSFSPYGERVLVRYRIATTDKMPRWQAKMSLRELREALEKRKDIESVFFGSLSGRVSHMDVCVWRVTVTVELVGMKQESFFHLVQ